MTINEWAKDFEGFINELDMPRDDYNGIMEYIAEGANLLKKQEPKKVVNIGTGGMCPMELTIRDYYTAAKRTMNPSLTWEQTRNHALHGIAGECGEIHSLYQKTYQGHELSKERVMDECGDLLWFVMELCFAEKIDPQEVLEYNIHKLMMRYPDGFSTERSIHREI